MKSELFETWNGIFDTLFSGVEAGELGKVIKAKRRVDSSATRLFLAMGRFFGAGQKHRSFVAKAASYGAALSLFSPTWLVK